MVGSPNQPADSSPKSVIARPAIRACPGDEKNLAYRTDIVGMANLWKRLAELGSSRREDSISLCWGRKEISVEIKGESLPWR